MPRTIKKLYHIKAPLHRVWRYFQDGNGLSSWFSERGTLLETHVGGRIAIYFAGINEIGHGRVTDYVPGKALGFNWNLGAINGVEGHSNVKFELSEEIAANGKPITLVQLTDLGIPSDPAWANYYTDVSAGWTYYLMSLKSVCETGYDLRDLQVQC